MIEILQLVCSAATTGVLAAYAVGLRNAERHRQLRAASRSLLDDLAADRDPSESIRRIQAALNDRPAP